MNETGRSISTISSLAVVAETIGDPPTVEALLYALGRTLSLVGTVSLPTMDSVVVSMEVGVKSSLSSPWALPSL